MPYQPRVHGECEAIRYLYQIVQGDVAEMDAAVTRARHFLQALGSGRRAGRPNTVTSPELLREVARLDGEGVPRREIAERLGMSHRTVDHHLRPSASMVDALKAQEAQG